MSTESEHCHPVLNLLDFQKHREDRLLYLVKNLRKITVFGDFGTGDGSGE